MRSLACLLGAGANGIQAVVLLAFFIVPLHSGSTLVALFFRSSVGVYGMGFLYTGIALVFKRTQALVGLVFG